jgi:phosphatidylinositol alpha-mannosyltransferase
MNKKMKIGLVCPYSMEKHGGVQEVVLALQAGLQANGHTAKIITPKPYGSTVYEDANKHMIYMGTSTDFRAVSHTTVQISNTDDGDKIDAILAKENFDVLNFHEPWIPFQSRQLLQRSNAVNIGTFHSKIHDAIVTRTVVKVVNPYLKSVLKYIDEMTAVSLSAADYVEGMTDQPITIIPNGIDLSKYKQVKTKKDPNEKMILYIGRLERRKGTKYLIRAFKLLAQDNPNVKLVIAGNGHEREMLELLAEDLKIKNITFLGYISEEHKLELLHQADIFCSPALFGESFGIVLLEAMATGAVSVVGNNSGYIDVMQGIGAMSIVNPEDSAEFARRLDMLIHENDLRRVWTKWAKNYVQQFDYPHVVTQYEDFYRQAIKEHKHAVAAKKAVS